jgi:4-hydroxy-3-methylbut-2-en-1-yl diphosphate synthase IspG/GcpE
MAGQPTAMVESALEHIAIFEKLNFYDIVVSLEINGNRHDGGRL